MSFKNNLRPISFSLYFFAIIMQLVIVEADASSLEDIPGDVVRVNLSKHLFVQDLVNLSQVSTRLRNEILGSDRGRKAIRSAMARLEIHVHNGIFDNKTLGYTEKQIARRLQRLMPARSDEKLPDLIPAAGSNQYLWGVKVMIYKSIPNDHFALFANCKNVSFARDVCLVNEDLKHFVNAVRVNLPSYHRVITDVGIANLKNVEYLNLTTGHPITYKGLVQLDKLKAVECCDSAQWDLLKNKEEQQPYKDILRARGVHLSAHVTNLHLKDETK